MIQRIQSVYVLLAAVVVLSIPFQPGLITPDGWDWYTPVKVAASVLISVGCLVAIFLYKDRERQKGLVTVDLLLSLVLAAILSVPGFMTAPTDILAMWPTLLPVVAAVLLVLARRAIKKDIELVRSMDRLR